MLQKQQTQIKSISNVTVK